jgi:hypothetical protein
MNTSAAATMIHALTFDDMLIYVNIRARGCIRPRVGGVSINGNPEGGLLAAFLRPLVWSRTERTRVCARTNLSMSLSYPRFTWRVAL